MTYVAAGSDTVTVMGRPGVVGTRTGATRAWGSVGVSPLSRQNATSGWTSNTRAGAPALSRNTASTSRIFGAIMNSCFDTLRGGSEVSDAIRHASP